MVGFGNYIRGKKEVFGRLHTEVEVAGRRYFRSDRSGTWRTDCYENVHPSARFKLEDAYSRLAKEPGRN